MAADSPHPSHPHLQMHLVAAASPITRHYRQPHQFQAVSPYLLPPWTVSASYCATKAVAGDAITYRQVVCLRCMPTEHPGPGTNRTCACTGLIARGHWLPFSPRSPMLPMWEREVCALFELPHAAHSCVIWVPSYIVGLHSCAPEYGRVFVFPCPACMPVWACGRGQL